MTSRGAAIQGFLALAGLVAAYVTWQREPSPDEGKVVVLDITKRELQKVRFEDGNTWVELTPGNDDGGEFTWVKLAGKKGSNAPLPSGHPVVQTEVPDRMVRGNDSAAKVWSLFAPLVASRTLGVLDEKLVEELGLAKSKKKLVVTHGGITRTFTVTPAPPGASEPYMRADDDGHVYVIPRQILTDFQAASSNMVERRFHSFLMADIDKLTITVGDRKKDFEYRRRDGTSGGDIIPVDTPDKPDQTVANWHERIFGLFPAEVLGKDEALPGAPPKVVARIDYLYRGRRVGWLELARTGDGATDPAQANPDTPPRTSVLARSEFTAGWMRLSLDAQGLVSEVETLFGAEQSKPAN